MYALCLALQLKVVALLKVKYEIVSKSTEKIFIDIGFWLVRGNLDKIIVPNSIKLFSNMKFGVKL